MADNPNWKTILDVLPESLHPLVKPVLEQWDQGVNAKFQSIRDEYKGLEAYKQLVDNNVDANYVMQAVEFADAVRENPGDMVKRINDTYNLGFVPQSQVQQPANNDDDEFDLDDLGEIGKHPLVKQLVERLDALDGKVTEDLTARQEREQQEQYEAYMKQLHDQHGQFDDIYVGAYLANGFSPEEAIRAYQQLVAQGLPNPGDQQQQNNQEQQNQVDANGLPIGDEIPDMGQQQNGNSQPPVVLDGSGTGAGVEQPTVDFGAMKKGDVTDLAIKFLEQSAAQNS